VGSAVLRGRSLPSGPGTLFIKVTVAILARSTAAVLAAEALMKRIPGPLYAHSDRLGGYALLWRGVGDTREERWNCIFPSPSGRELGRLGPVVGGVGALGENGGTVFSPLPLGEG
jgi:hypothetical protein